MSGEDTTINGIEKGEAVVDDSDRLLQENSLLKDDVFLMANGAAARAQNLTLKVGKIFTYNGYLLDPNIYEITVEAN